jgi:hypothetical protein
LCRFVTGAAAWQRLQVIGEAGAWFQVTVAVVYGTVPVGWPFEWQ